MKTASLLLLGAFALPPAMTYAQARGRVEVDVRLPVPVVVVQEHPAPPRPPPPAPPPPPAMPPPPRHHDVLRVKEIKAGRVHARIIYAKEVKAKGGHIGRIVQDRGGEAWEGGRGDGEINAPEVFADVIYAKEIKADWIEAGEVHAKEVKIGK